ncbi:rhamnogalacturonan acetylesterase RgaE [Aspergillus novofumigatus IBT 16806]|uniref:Putative rhamnogalacturonan acetylesterase n=1 Tax=Aspergillus novofumigatus (strain IBT 16806) TaxID=1392255 RepID=A0A2I1BTP0_ASPN1|nr:putative rhamnogalacturonan acetylesterase [Aspergillus novofumigatus IBT 16806]PKX88726.1 putative rhamnogalacturonan acetylesterase [Aspergillus novofumigatus IBT 16806]
MKCFTLLSALALLPGTLSATIYMAGDSTMAKGGGGANTDGWGLYIAPFVSATVSNKAVGGRSARSYTREKRFQAIADVLKPGDYVVIEFGHNDGGSLSTDNGRTDCPGTGDETCTTTYNGVQETVLTFPKYLENAAQLFLSKQAKVLIASQTPNNPWETGTFSYTPSRFVELAKLAAQKAGVGYVDHGAYVADMFKSLGKTTVDSYFPNDHTHTSAKGAEVVAHAFLKGVVCSGANLKEVLTTTDFSGRCL